MNSKAESEAGVLDTAKLAVAALVLLAGIVGYYYYEEESMLLRVSGVLVCAAAALVVAFQSVQGQDLWRFIQGSRVELRKVVWPTRQETVQTTLTVMVFVLIMGVFFWLLDMGLLWVTRQLTGQGG
jgi:preprotein translocase subunit SecE